MPQDKQTATASTSAFDDDLALATNGGPQWASGAAAIDRIANTPEATPDFWTALASELGPFASEFGGFDPTLLAPITDQIVTSVSASTSTESAAPTPPLKADDSKPSELSSLVAQLDKEIQKHLAPVEEMLPAGLRSKIDAFTQGHPDLVAAAVITAALADYFSGHLKPPALSNKFNLGSGLSVTPTVQLGAFREKFVQSIGATLAYNKGNFNASASASVDLKGKAPTEAVKASASYKAGDWTATANAAWDFENGKHQTPLHTAAASLAYKHGNFDASAGANFDFRGGTQQYSLALSEKEIELLGQHLDASFNYTLTDGTKPSQKVTEALKLANFHLQNTTTWAPGAGAKGKPGPTQMTDSLTESYTSDKFGDGWQVSGSATENFGRGHAQDTAKLGVTLPAINGVVVTVSDEQTFHAGSKGGFNTQAVNFKINERLSIDVQHGAPLSGDNVEGRFSGGGDHTWSVGLKFKF